MGKRLFLSLPTPKANAAKRIRRDRRNSDRIGGWGEHSVDRKWARGHCRLQLRNCKQVATPSFVDCKGQNTVQMDSPRGYMTGKVDKSAPHRGSVSPGQAGSSGGSLRWATVDPECYTVECKPIENTINQCLKLDKSPPPLP